jgi:hypothetical protein
VPDRLPHPHPGTHGDGYADAILDRMLTELEGIRDEFVAELRALRADYTARTAAPADSTVDEPAAWPAPIDITEPAPGPARPRGRKVTSTGKEPGP